MIIAFISIGRVLASCFYLLFSAILIALTYFEVGAEERHCFDKYNKLTQVDFTTKKGLFEVNSIRFNTQGFSYLALCHSMDSGFNLTDFYPSNSIWTDTSNLCEVTNTHYLVFT
jgi:hypothetical protein